MLAAHSRDQGHIPGIDSGPHIQASEVKAQPILKPAVKTTAAYGLRECPKVVEMGRILVFSLDAWSIREMQLNSDGLPHGLPIIVMRKPFLSQMFCCSPLPSTRVEEAVRCDPQQFKDIR